MKNSIKLLAAIVLMAGFTASLMAQGPTDTQSNEARAQILGAIALTTVNPLEFGGIVPHPTLPGTVIVDNADGRTNPDANLTLVATTKPQTSGSYTVTGTGLITYVITLPSASFDITNTTAGAATMAVTAMTCSKGAVVGGHVNSVFLANGTDSFKIGATLAVAADQAEGLYVGTFDVTVAY
jgi:Mat/Ecp fimbriae major subunit